MNDPNAPFPQLSPEEATLESELKRLRPAKAPAAFREAALSAFESSALSPEDEAFASLLAAQRPSSPSASLWESIEEQLAPAAPKNVISVPRWRDFAPIFKVAAMLAIGIFAAASILKPDDQPEAAIAPEVPTGQLVPISRSGTIQSSQRVKFMERNKQIYEQRLQTRRDRSQYQLAPDLHVEDEVTTESKVYSPRRTF